MTKTIFITGASDGLGLHAAKALAAMGHDVILHGRSAGKVGAVKAAHPELANAKHFLADLSDLPAVRNMTAAIKSEYDRIDVLINNAGVFTVGNPVLPSGHDMRFVVNSFAPALITQDLLEIIPTDGRVLNLSSAAQAPVDVTALRGDKPLSANGAYAQSKLALTMWSAHLAKDLPHGPAVLAVNPGSLLATKMVKDAYAMDGKDITVGSKALVKLAIEEDLTRRSGQYFDNDRGDFGAPHPDALDPGKSQAISSAIDAEISKLMS